MRNAFWHSWSRISGMLFLGAASALFFTPPESSWSLTLATAALAAGATWVHQRDKHN